jgi:hypothetical protein
VSARRTSQRVRFLSDVLITAIEHGGYGFATCHEYQPEPGGDPAGTYAIVADRYLAPGDDGYGRTWRLDLDTIAHGMTIIRRAFVATDGVPTRHAPGGSGDVVYVHPDSWERLYLSHGLRRELLVGDRANDAGEFDVIGALAVVEIALFGAVVYC